MTTSRRLFFFVLLCCAAPLHADPFTEFEARARAELIKPFALDLGGVLGGTSFHTGKSLGFPGFEVGAVGVTQFQPDKNDRILRDAGIKVFGVPMLYAAVGLPGKLDVVAHGLPVQGGSVFGGGLRYGVFKSDVKTVFLPSVGVSIFADKVNHAAFSAVHYAANVSAVLTLPIVSPFLGAGIDTTQVTVGASALTGLPGLSATATGSRFTAGLDMTPFPFLRARVATMLFHGAPGGMINAGVKF